MSFLNWHDCLCALVLSVLMVPVHAQELIPNGGFESFHYTPMKWNTSGSDFNGIFENWSSPTQASPDAYGPGIEIPDFWRKQGFGFITPIQGKGFVGITIYGCTGKPHCREYIQVRMNEKLVPGQQYELSFVTSPLPKGMRCNNIGLAFSYDSLKIKLDSRIEIAPIATIKKIVNVKPGKWGQAKVLFQAKARESFLIIGNFYTDEQTKAKKEPIYTKLKYAYYYFDDFRLKKIPPIIEYVDTANVFLERTFDIDDRVILENVYFDYNKSSLLPKSFLTLAHLLELLNQYETIEIELVGHTDSDGHDLYNRRLSEDRAERVYTYLIDQGIGSGRLSFKGDGEQFPIATNDTDEGKGLNRRVEFRIVAQ